MLRQLTHDHDAYLPDGLPSLANAQTALPAIAKNADLIGEIENAVRRIPTSHEVMIGDSRVWHKISNAVYEVAGTGSSFLGKPYEPNAVIKNDLEYILMQRKPGGYRSPSVATRILSVIGDANHKEWFQQIWTGVTGASTRNHPAPYPLQLAERLIRMFSFVGDTVLDPFLGTGTTTVAAMQHGRNSMGYEVDVTYAKAAMRRINAAKTLATVTEIRLHEEA